MRKTGLVIGDEVIKMIVAVIGLVLLAVFAVLIYNTFFSQNTQLQQAKSSVNSLATQINSKYSFYQIYNPKNWWLESFPMTVKNVVGTPTEVPVPESCSSVGWKSCLCICLHNPTESSTPCEGSDGVCVENDFVVLGSPGVGVSGLNEILLNNPPKYLVINQTDKTIYLGSSS